MEEGIRDDLSDRPAACGNCISRRAFVAQSAAITAAAAFFSACGDGIIGGGRLTGPGRDTQIKVGDFPGLATVGTLVLIDSERAVKRTGATTFAAFSRECTHEGTALNLTGSGFVCPNHQAQFDNNGAVTSGPNGGSPGSIRSLFTIVTAYDPATDLLTVG